MALPELPDGFPVGSLALVILDGWGIAEPGPGNAISLAETPTFDALWTGCPHTTLSASGRDVGLPEGQMGNSEVGHLNLGAGSVVKQDLARIDDAVADGSFFDNEVLRAACERAVESPRGRLHLIGLVSDGGVHSGWEHIEAMIELAAREGVPDVVLHALTDGRDTSPSGGPAYLEQVSRWLQSAGRFGTVGGRYYGMDRDHRWERTKLAYDAIVHAQGPHADDAVAAVRDSHEAGETDEFVKPTVIGDYDGVADGDVIITFNFRPDRMRQIVETLGDPDFDAFDRGDSGPFDVTTMTEYRSGWPYPVAFPPREPATTMAATISAAGGAQLHVAETEKYAHVTYFFNGGREAEWQGEERQLVDSPRDVPTYDYKPEMSANAAADAFCEAWSSAPGEGFRFGIINFANPDMVGHTGDIPAATKAIETADGCLARVVAAVHARGGALPDHGRPRQCRPHAQRRRLPQHGSYDESGAADRDGERHRARRRRHPRGRLTDGLGPAGDRSTRGDDRAIADQGGLTKSSRPGRLLPA